MDDPSPGCFRDVRLHTDVAAELEFFNDPLAARDFIETGIVPLVRTLPPQLRLVDLGGGDGFLLEQVAQVLRGRGHHVHALVVDANAGSLLRAQARGLDVLPGHLERLRLRPAQVFLMRLVNHYNGYARQLAIFSRVWESLTPGGYLILQSETGSRSHCAYRNLVSQLLENAKDGVSRAKKVRHWLPVETLVRILHRRGLQIIQLEPRFLSFETRLRTLLQLAWDRLHGFPMLPAELDLRELAVTAALGIAQRHLLDSRVEGLSADAAGQLVLRTCHALIVARKPPDSSS